MPSLTNCFKTPLTGKSKNKSNQIEQALRRVSETLKAKRASALSNQPSNLTIKVQFVAHRVKTKIYTLALETERMR